MAQSFTNALLVGAKDEKMAIKISKGISIYGFIMVMLGLSLLLLPYEPLQSLISESTQNRTILYITAAISSLLLYFLYLGKFWAAAVLLGLTIIDGVITYLDTNKISGSFKIVDIFLYLAAAQATYFLLKNKPSNVEISGDDKA
jgi:hypothetical protein